MKKRLMHAQKLQKIKKACLKNNYNLKNTIYITSKNFFADAMHARAGTFYRKPSRH